MPCPNKMFYTIHKGDTLYSLAQRFHTTVPSLMQENPHLDPRRLPIGAVIGICPGFSVPPHNGMSAAQVGLMANMRIAWMEHVMWSRSLIISIAEKLADEDAVTNRLLLNPAQIAALFRPYYGPTAALKIQELLTEHLVIGKELITAVTDGDTAAAEDANHRWYQNADEMAVAFHSLNPYYGLKEMREMLYTHLDLTKQELGQRLEGNYPADISTYDTIESQAIHMADTFTNGIFLQQPDKF